MRRERAGYLRAAFALLGCPTLMLTAFSVLRLAGGPRPAAGAPARIMAMGEARPPAARGGEALMEAGAQAAARGDLAGADDAYRQAWRDATTRVRAAAALQDLHRTPGFRLPTDEGAVERTARLLGPGFRRSETAHFVVLSDCPEDWTQGRARVLERTRDQFFRVAARMSAPVYPHRAKLLCVLFAQRDDYAAFARAQDGMDAGWIAGYYATLSNRIVFYNDSTSPGFAAAGQKLADADAQVRLLRDRALDAERDGRSSGAAQLRGRAEDLERQVRRERARLGRAASDSSTSKATHEATHLLAFNTGLQLPDREYPFWVSEGLATSFETDRADAAFGPDRGGGRGDRRQRFEELRDDGKLIPLADLVGRCEAPREDAERADAMYAESFVLFSWLFARDPGAVGAFLSELGQGQPARLSPERAVALFAAHFGDPAQVEQRLTRRGR